MSLTVSSELTDEIIVNRINDAEEIVEQDLSKFVVFPINGTRPIYLKRLSIYKATELCLVWLYSAKREGDDQDDIRYWQKQYDKLVKKIRDGEIDLGDYSTGVGVFKNTARPNIEPPLGTGPYGGFQTIEDLQNERPTL